uniref:AlNc14C177G8145 protein n=1 Tax=Albugo laibachii Nc14 TaxID=890382 RepID=F0WNZ1_9STRA|nr:AlNc14C177G8145 [Albugo laibachii Nc14]|eukprot:CCA23034.1 AlNc14C177G8145 [Albugo laibachii Nc14]
MSPFSTPITGLYHARSIDFSWTSSSSWPSITSDAYSIDCEQPTSNHEIFLSAIYMKLGREGEITRMHGHSSPGMDGLPAEFCQLAPSVFCECLQIFFGDRLRRVLGCGLSEARQSRCSTKQDLVLILVTMVPLL